MTEQHIPRIELVYFKGCPHADQARANLRRVLSSLERPEEWREWVQDDEDTPRWALDLPSPTVLVEGESVMGPSPEADGRACAPGGAPSPDAILQALTGRDAD